MIMGTVPSGRVTGTPGENAGLSSSGVLKGAPIGRSFEHFTHQKGRIMATKKETIHRDLQSESAGTPAGLDTLAIRHDLRGGSMISDSNHVMRRLFRCYLDGSYDNQGDYKRTCAYLVEYGDNPKKVRSFVIMRFASYIAVEYDCHYSTAQKAITSAFSKPDLERLTAELIDDALDLIRD